MKKMVVVVGELDPGEDNGNDVRRLEREERSTAAKNQSRVPLHSQPPVNYGARSSRLRPPA